MYNRPKCKCKPFTSRRKPPAYAAAVETMASRLASHSESQASRKGLWLRLGALESLKTFCFHFSWPPSTYSGHIINYYPCWYIWLHYRSCGGWIKAAGPDAFLTGSSRTSARYYANHLQLSSMPLLEVRRSRTSPKGSPTHFYQQESPANAKVSVRQQCVYEGSQRRNLGQINVEK